MKTDSPSYNVRTATRADVPAIKAMVDTEGWEIDEDLLYCMFDLDSRAWFVAEADTGEIIGVRAMTYFNSKVTGGGIYIVKKDVRGQGIGRAVNTAALKSVGDSNVILFAYDVNLYNTRGFTYDHDVYLKRLNVGEILDALPVEELPTYITIKPYSSTMMSDMIRYDYDICKHERPEYLQKWVIQRAENIVIAYSEKENFAGYGSLRVTQYGYQIAPLYADSDASAWSLMRQLLKRVDRRNFVTLFITSENREIDSLLKGLPQQHVTTLHKMYNKNRILMVMEKVYSLSCLDWAAV